MLYSFCKEKGVGLCYISKNGRVIDPVTKTDKELDILVCDGKILMAADAETVERYAARLQQEDMEKPENLYEIPLLWQQTHIRLNVFIKISTCI